MPKEQIYPDDVRYPGVHVGWDKGDKCARISLYQENTILGIGQIDRLISVLKKVRRQISEERLPDLYILVEDLDKRVPKRRIRDIVVELPNLIDLEGLRVQDVYVSRNAVAPPSFSEANRAIRRIFSKTAGSHKLHIIS